MSAVLDFVLEEEQTAPVADDSKDTSDDAASVEGEGDGADQDTEEAAKLEGDADDTEEEGEGDEKPETE